MEGFGKRSFEDALEIAQHRDGWMEDPQPKRTARVSEREELRERLKNEFYNCGFSWDTCEAVAVGVWRKTKSLQHISNYWNTALRRCALLREALRPIRCEDLLFELSYSFVAESKAMLKATVNTTMDENVFLSRVEEFKAAVEPHVVVDPIEKQKKDRTRHVNESLAVIWPIEGLDIPVFTRDRVDEAERTLQVAKHRIASLSESLPVDGLFLYSLAMDVSCSDAAWASMMERLKRIRSFLTFAYIQKKWSNRSSRAAAPLFQLQPRKVEFPSFQRRGLEFIRYGTSEEYVSRFIGAYEEAKQIVSFFNVNCMMEAIEEFAETGVDTTFRALKWMWFDLFDGVRETRSRLDSSVARVRHCRKATLTFIACWRFSDERSFFRLIDRNVMLLIARIVWESRQLSNSAKWSIYSWVSLDSITRVVDWKFPPPPPGCRNCGRRPGYCSRGCNRGYCGSCCFGCNRW